MNWMELLVNGFTPTGPVEEAESPPLLIRLECECVVSIYPYTTFGSIASIKSRR